MFDALFFEQLGKILLAAVLSGAIGIERLVTDKPAGLRTCILIGTSACAYSIISMDAFLGMTMSDPGRIAAQIVVGVGFIGGGSLLHNHNHVIGLTTAASIWTVAAVGMAVGLGLPALALSITGITLFTLWLLAPVSLWIEKRWRIKKKH